MSCKGPGPFCQADSIKSQEQAGTSGDFWPVCLAAAGLRRRQGASFLQWRGFFSAADRVSGRLPEPSLISLLREPPEKALFFPLRPARVVGDGLDDGRHQLAELGCGFLVHWLQDVVRRRMVAFFQPCLENLFLG